MVGVSGTSSSTKSAGLSQQHFVTTEQSSQSGAATGNTFNLRAKALAVRQGFDQVQDQPKQQGRNNLDPAVLARIALEEELKKKGGGGGGTRPYNPMLWVPYSFKLLAKAIEEIRQAFEKAISQSLNALPNFVSRGIISTTNSVNKFFAPITTPIAIGLANILNTLSKGLNSFIKNPLEATNRMLMNAAQVALVITSAIINGLKKVFFGKDEDKLEVDEEIYESEEKQGLMSRLLGFFTKTR